MSVVGMCWSSIVSSDTLHFRFGVCLLMLRAAELQSYCPIKHIKPSVAGGDWRAQHQTPEGSTVRKQNASSHLKFNISIKPPAFMY